jgi:hypothetical protein
LFTVKPVDVEVVINFSQAVYIYSTPLPSSPFLPN